MMQKSWRRSTLFLCGWIGLLGLLGLVACAPPDEPLPQLEQSKLESIVKSNNEFAYKIYKELRVEGKNIFFSPYSISSALAMATAGAKGETEKEMLALLGYGQAADEMHKANAWLSIDLNNRGKTGNIQLSVANRLWGQKDYPFKEDFLKILQENYLAPLAQADFKGNADGERQKINDWVAQKTNDRIKNLFPPGSINGITKLVLANAIYFKGNWWTQFEKSSTQKRPFQISAEKEIQVDMMSSSKIEAKFYQNHNSGLDVLSLPYKEKQISMVIVQPKLGQLAKIEGELSAAKLKTWLDQAQEYNKLQVSMPKFKLEQKWDLKELLNKLGMKQAFIDGKADFSGIAENSGLFIQSIVHKAFVEVNEEGTEAAAATGISFGATSAPPKSANIHRPFLFMIYDHKTNNILFMGRILDPSKSE